jgi:N-methylhydantoinase A/oxoprolinase/acetone carboxylase beta subunit
LTIPVATNNPRQIRDAFLAAHRERLGHEGAGQAVELVNLRVVAVREAPLLQLAGNAGSKRTAAKSRGRRSVVLGRGSKRVTAALWPLDDLGTGVTLDGPAILAGRDATALIESGWRGTVHASGAILVERV